MKIYVMESPNELDLAWSILSGSNIKIALGNASSIYILVMEIKRSEETAKLTFVGRVTRDPQNTFGRPCPTKGPRVKGFLNKKRKGKGGILKLEIET